MHIERSSNKSYPVLKLPPPAPPIRRGRVDYQAVSPLVQGGVSGGSFSKLTFWTIPPKISSFPFYAVVIFTCWEGEAR